jgi:hypothetical protein
VLATVSCLSDGAQTINVTTLDQAGAQMVLQAAKASAQQRHAPSAIAVVIRPGICLLLSGWTVCGRRAWTSRSGRHERPRGYNDRLRRSRTTSTRVERRSSPPTCGAARRRADTRRGRSRRRGRHSWLEQGHGRGHREHRGGSAGCVAGDSRASLREFLFVWLLSPEAMATRPIQQPGRDAIIFGPASGETSA